MLGVVDKVKGGDFTQRIRVVSNDEIGVLGDAGNDMIRGLAVRLSYPLIGDTVNLLSRIQELIKTFHHFTCKRRCRNRSRGTQGQLLYIGF